MLVHWRRRLLKEAICINLEVKLFQHKIANRLLILSLFFDELIEKANSYGVQLDSSSNGSLAYRLLFNLNFKLKSDY